MESRDRNAVYLTVWFAGIVDLRHWEGSIGTVSVAFVAAFFGFFDTGSARARALDLALLGLFGALGILLALYRS